MKNINKAYIENFFNQELCELKASIKDGKHPYHCFYFSTYNDNWPEIRTVVLRNIDNNPLSIRFNSDIRSKKVADIKKNNQCSALFYDPIRRIQIRVKGLSTIHYNNKLSEKVWSDVELQSRKCYMADFAPGEVMDEWKPNIPKLYLKKDPTLKDSEKGYINFCCIDFKVESFEILELHHDGHIRFEIVHHDKGKEYIFLAT